MMKGWSMCVTSEDAAGVGMIQEGLDCFQDTSTGLGGPYLVALLTEALRVVGQDPEALGAIDAALELGARQKSYFWHPELMRLKSEVLLAGDSNARQESEALLREAIESAKKHGAVSFELRSALSLCDLKRGTSGEPQAISQLREAYDRIPERSDTIDQRRAKSVLSAD